MATKWETDVFLMEMFWEALPPVLESAFPYRLVIQPSEVQMSGALHETFHAYQAQVAPDRLDEAEQAHSRGEAYWAADAQMHAEWQQEIALLAQALKAESEEDAATLARQFLAQREQRRAAHNLDADLTDYERLLEWEERIAKYVDRVYNSLQTHNPGKPEERMAEASSTLIRSKDSQASRSFAAPPVPTEKIRVLIVDDHAVVRQGLRTFLELHGDPSSGDPSALPIEVVGEAADGAQAVDLARRLQPDVVLLDLVMPGMDGIQATPKIAEGSPRSCVIILTSFGEEDKVIPAIRAGAQGYLLKDIPPDELARAVRAAYLGQVQLHPDVARKLMSVVAAKEEPPASRPHQAAVDELTGRELEVLGLIARGFNNREIAETMVISEKTVKTHVSSILGKLHLEDRTQAAIYALRHGLAPDGA